MNEDFLQFIWKFQLFDKTNLKTTDGQSVELEKIGFQNTHSGPDFTDAKLKINNTVWAGNIEVEVKSSNWYLHKHHQNAAFNNVVLVVCLTADQNVTNNHSVQIPILEIEPRQNMLEQYQHMMNSQHWAMCQNYLPKIDEFFIKNWINQLLIERLQEKTDDIRLLLQKNKNNWEEAFYQKMAANFGIKINTEPFQQLASSIALTILGKHKNNLMQIEALLFGQAGFLGATHTDQYAKQLWQEYQFLAQKYQLTPLDPSQWKFMRLRPPSFPTIRIALFAKLIHQSQALFSKIVEKPHLQTITQLLDVEASEYWKTHYKFDKASGSRTKKTGRQFVENVIINTVVPFVFVYAQQKSLPELQEKALELLEALPAEKNSIVENWNKYGLTANSAFESQAYLQLRKKYCTPKKCVHCHIGVRIFSGKT